MEEKIYYSGDIVNNYSIEDNNLYLIQNGSCIKIYKFKKKKKLYSKNIYIKLCNIKK